MRKTKRIKKQAALLDSKQSVSKNELLYLRNYASKSVIAAFANHKPLGQ